eukprot:TRINITY_DN5045_c0_g1_i1.p1 TRINITY_DN5045_c0_g1~~TRINITY_DN5045_c0_g1_i1.p1  ORF type:complete len:315 (-),score=40.44 TRINITY_DN5045_c0_g1_i1:602-1480(-)
MGNSDVGFKLHPLVLINITDHYNRCKQGGGSCRVVGCLLGQSEGRNIALVNSFEVKYGVEVDEEFLNSRRDQFKQVFPALDVLGWYSTGHNLQPQDLLLQEKIMKGSQCEAAVYLLMDVQSGDQQQQLPIQLYETQVHLNTQGVAETHYRRIEFQIETYEAERIGVEQMSKVLPGGQTDSIDQLAQHLSGILSAINMLQERIGMLQQLLNGMQSNKVEIQHALIRQINILVHQFPLSRVQDFRQEQILEQGETLICANLSQMTQNAYILLDVVDKYVVAYDKTHRRGRGPNM